MAFRRHDNIHAQLNDGERCNLWQKKSALAATFTLCMYASPVQELHEHADDASEIREWWMSLILGTEFPQLAQIRVFSLLCQARAHHVNRKSRQTISPFGLRTRG